jgi:hypothetical protein
VAISPLSTWRCIDESEVESGVCFGSLTLRFSLDTAENMLKQMLVAPGFGIMTLKFLAFDGVAEDLRVSGGMFLGFLMILIPRCVIQLGAAVQFKVLILIVCCVTYCVNVMINCYVHRIL